MKKLISILILAAMTAMLCAPAGAAHVSGSEAVETLETLGLVQGTGSGFEPERTATRSEALVMLLRLLGEAASAGAETEPCRFYDGGWAATYLQYAWNHGLIRGISAYYFGSDIAVCARDYLTMCLRALGYSEAAGDFSWQGSIAFADQIGLTHGEYSENTPFLREDLALVSYTALTLKLKNSNETLIQKLYRAGVVSAADLKKTRLAGTVNLDKPVLSPAEIHEQCVSATVFVEVYADAEDFAKDEAAAIGSGFFITGDGVAALCYHQIEGRDYVRVTTSDGRKYDVTGVLAYDPSWDYALVRVSLTDTEGRTVRFFPYLDMGDSDSLTIGEPVYTISSPKGHIDSMSEGILSNPGRFVDDPDYLMLQMTAAVSKGSSGGPVLNAYGEVIGLVYGSFLDGQSLNLAVPINALADCSRQGSGESPAQVRETQDAAKAAAVLSADTQEVHLKVDEETSLMICGDWPGSIPVQYLVADTEIIACRWGDFESKHSVALHILGVSAGEADVRITYTDSEEINDTELVIHVIVSEKEN